MTYVYEQLTTNEIARRLRQDDNAGWSYEGAVALAEYLEQLAEDTGKPIELDVVALRCDFSEYVDLTEFNKQYDKQYATIDDVREDTTVIEFGETGQFIAQAF